MFRTVIAATLVSAALAGCQTTPQQKDGPVLRRIDGRSASSSPELAQQARRDMAICKGEADKASLRAGPVFYSTNLAGNIAADQIVGQQRKKVVSVYLGCMAERGYLPGDGPATVTP